jgi:hypothetical protein
MPHARCLLYVGEGIRTPSEQALDLLPLPIGIHRLDADEGIRTPINLVLSQAPLPIGLHRHTEGEGFEPPVGALALHASFRDWCFYQLSQPSQMDRGGT